MKVGASIPFFNIDDVMCFPLTFLRIYAIIMACEHGVIGYIYTPCGIFAPKKPQKAVFLSVLKILMLCFLVTDTVCAFPCVRTVSFYQKA